MTLEQRSVAIKAYSPRGKELPLWTLCWTRCAASSLDSAPATPSYTSFRYMTRQCLCVCMCVAVSSGHLPLMYHKRLWNVFNLPCTWCPPGLQLLAHIIHEPKCRLSGPCPTFTETLLRPACLCQLKWSLSLKTKRPPPADLALHNKSCIIRLPALTIESTIFAHKIE